MELEGTPSNFQELLLSLRSGVMPAGVWGSTAGVVDHLFARQAPYSLCFLLSRLGFTEVALLCLDSEAPPVPAGQRRFSPPSSVFPAMGSLQ